MKKINKFEFENRKLNVNFNLIMNNEVDIKVLDILKKLHQKFPVNQFEEINYILSKKKQMMFRTVNIPKLFENKAIILISYLGMFIDNEKHNYELTKLENFDAEEFEETALHESVHAYHVIYGKYSKQILKNLLELDKFKNKRNSKKHIINELNRFSKQCLFEGYAQVICHLGKYYHHTKSNIKERYDIIINYANELNNTFNKYKKSGIKKDFIDLLLKYPYWYGPQMYNFIMYYNNKKFEDFKDYNVEQLFKEFEEILENNNLKIPISLNSGKGIFDIKEGIRELQNDL